MRGKPFSVDRALLLRTYNEQGRSLNQTAKTFGVSATAIKNAFRRHWLQWDPKIQYHCDEAFFDELNERSMYWLGFLITDGNVCKHAYSYEIKLALATKDRERVEAFKTDLRAENPIHDYIIVNKRKPNKYVHLQKDEYYSSTICIVSKKLFDRLCEFGIVPAKTYIVKFPEQLRAHPLLRHFIRGVIDGDGWVSEHEGKRVKLNKVRIGLCGMHDFVREVFDLIKQHTGVESGSFTKKGEGDYTWQFEFENLHDVDKIVDWLYQDATTWLIRKRKIADKAKGFAARDVLFQPSKKELQVLLDEHKTITALYKATGTSYRTLKQYLVEYDIEHRTAALKSYNEGFFAKGNESEVQFYWAGWAAGKSTIVETKTQRYLALGDKDASHLERFLTDSGSQASILFSGERPYLNICSDKIMDDLRDRFSINKNKETHYIIPEWVIDHEFLHHFLRGYVDAKSCLQNYGKLSLKLINSFEFLSTFDSLMKSKGQCELTPSIKPNRYGNDQSQIIYLGNQAKSILRYLHQDATVYLARKYDLAQSANAFAPSVSAQA